MTGRTISLPDGRQLGFARYGPANGYPVLYFHGTPSSRLEPGLLQAYGINPEQLLQQTGLQLITVDRPGMGFSSFNPRGTLLSVAQDAAALLHSLQITRCSVMCWSGGGPFALAMTWQFPEIVRDAYILCGFTRQFTPAVMGQMYLNKWYFQTARHAPLILEKIMNQMRHSNAERSIPQWLTGMPDADYELFKDPQHRQALAVHSLKEACRNGARGAVHDAQVYFDPFGFRITEIRQPVHYWWGTEDRNVVRLHMEAVRQHLPNGQVYIKEGEGHLSLYVRYFHEVIKAIASAKSPAAS